MAADIDGSYAGYVSRMNPAMLFKSTKTYLLSASSEFSAVLISFFHLSCFKHFS